MRGWGRLVVGAPGDDREEREGGDCLGEVGVGVEEGELGELERLSLQMLTTSFSLCRLLLSKPHTVDLPTSTPS